MVPETFGDKAENLKNWQEEVEEYMDSQAPAHKKIFQRLGEQQELGSLEIGDHQRGEKSGRGTKQGIILAEFSGMVRKLATTPGELVTMMIEMDKKIRMIEEMIPCQDGNSPISSLHKKSVLAGIMDPMTRQHTSTHQEESFEERSYSFKVVLGVR